MRRLWYLTIVTTAMVVSMVSVVTRVTTVTKVTTVLRNLRTVNVNFSRGMLSLYVVQPTVY
jgi:hypothetical protein